VLPVPAVARGTADPRGMAASSHAEAALGAGNARPVPASKTAEFAGFIRGHGCERC